jgi:bacillithiol biosynthesis cysteine-adding enzyme BshC
MAVMDNSSSFLFLPFMDCISTRLPYRQTAAFNKTVLDYIDQLPYLRPFYAHPPSVQGIQKTIEARKKFDINREILVHELKKEYEGVETSPRVKKNIESLLSKDTFTITTAHQNNIFTGPLYFIYKILHVIRLADYLKESLPAHHFVPVFFIGSEDADLDELNHIYTGGEKLTWKTKQQGAVGRMKVDKELLNMISQLEGQLSVLPHGTEILSMIRSFYKDGNTIQDATFRFVNALFGEKGLVVLLPDNPSFKKQMKPVFEDDLLNQTASGMVEDAAAMLQEAGYKVQVNPREINLFYLKGDIRERIIRKKDKFTIHDSRFTFSEEELLDELKQHPEHFSPNVILRGLYQGTILPDVAFIGGGAEIAYWLQLKTLFDHYKVPYPVLVLRNSFLIIEKKWGEKIAKLGFAPEEFFLPEQELMNRLVAKESKNAVKLNGALSELEQLYNAFKKQAAAVDSTLEQHVDALKYRTLHRLQELEKKMLKAEKRKFSDQERQIHTIKEHLFPGNGLQERYDNICYYYAKWGKEILQKLYEQSLALEQEFCILAEKA